MAQDLQYIFFNGEKIKAKNLVPVQLDFNGIFVDACMTPSSISKCLDKIKEVMLMINGRNAEAVFSGLLKANEKNDYESLKRRNKITIRDMR